ncbi:uracil-xanthine permease [Enterococcus haemoperoxidus ATCC BAA-382]|uniref:Uracil-xanthine permease n=1 Tax=Enterococcus haemoperoxidus ATCC BAA-382 TaxID=1158608 RepID=R2T492_9ENTE|nr:solute carrier family 23 protein [Enterococcus haemoperoxidus]EOH99816.1 uracil-xanthine permease [Enterococcus haemoperoxidus ATCC BAA-382]EOT62442.1 xanthine/uracil permease [Enterococcus haemoperoxidus ATCC BAA-382]OJG54298.1 uracil-xanthine permease [Enterococcus haemoperoxidus]
MTETQINKSKLTVGPNDDLSIGQSALLGIQHVLAMDVYVVPFIIASIIGLSTKESSALIQSTFIAAGIATIIQSYFCMKLPVAQGPSFIPIGAVAGIYFANSQSGNGWGTVLGASLIGAVLVIILGVTGIFNRLIKAFVPPIVGGTIIFIVGLSLMPVALNDNVFKATGDLGQNILLAVIAATSLVLFAMIGSRFPGKGRIFRVSSVILALVIGSLAAQSMGILDLSQVGNASLISIPQLPFVDFHFSFDLSSIITMVIIYVVLMAETTGTWFAVSNVCEAPLTDENINRGVVGEGIGCLISSLLGTTPVTGYSTNAGIISITGVASKKVFVAAGAWFVVFGLSGKLSTLISSIPSPVIGGVFVIVCGIISISGIKVIKEVEISEKEMYVIAIPMILTLALTLIPKDFIQSLPQLLQYFFGSSVATASIAAILLNRILPAEKVEEQSVEHKEINAV